MQHSLKASLGKKAFVLEGFVGLKPDPPAVRAPTGGRRTATFRPLRTILPFSVPWQNA